MCIRDRYKTNLGPILRHNPVRCVMHLEDDTAALFDEACGSRIEDDSGFVRCDSAEMSSSLSNLTLSSSGRIPDSTSLRICNHVMHDLTIARTYFHRLDPFVLSESGWEIEVEVRNRTVSRDRVLLRHLKDYIRSANRPSLCELRHRRKVLVITFGRSGTYPLNDSVYVLLRKTGIVCPVPVLGICSPWRH